MTKRPTTLTYDAVSASGKKQNGSTEAKSRLKSLSQPKSMAKQVSRVKADLPTTTSSTRTSLRNKKQQASLKHTARHNPSREGEFLSEKELELLTRQLAKMLNANLSLERSMTIITRGDASLKRVRLAHQVLTALRRGSTPSQAFAAILGPRDQTFIALIRSGELSGNLGHAFGEMEKLLVARNQMLKKVQAALIYPSVLTFVSILSLSLILFFVIPRFETLLGQNGSELPLASQIVFGLSQTIRSLWLPLSGVLLAVFYFAGRAFKNGGLYRLLNMAFAFIPSFKTVPASVEVSKLCRLLGTLLSNNVRLVSALDVAEDATEDTRFKAAIGFIDKAVTQGDALAVTMAKTGLFPDHIVQMIEVGEESGELGTMFSKSADMMDEEIDRQTQRFLILFEPTILIVLGLMIGGLLFGLFSAILSINDVAF